MAPARDRPYNTRMRLARSVTTGIFSLALAACSSAQPDATKSVREALATLSAEGDAAGLTTALFATAGRRIVLAGEGAKLSFLPRGCLTTTHDEAAKTITYAFASCTYLRSIRVNGTLTMTYEESPDGYEVTMTAPELRFGTAVISLMGSAKVQADEAGIVRISLETRLEGQGKAGTFTRSVKRTTTWALGTACFDAEGVSEGEINGRNVSVTVGPYRRCRSQCPEAKSEVVIREAGRTYRLMFDGSDTASLIEDGESPRTLSLVCER